MSKGSEGVNRRTSSHASRRAVVLVLGDIGRSPRMQYHAHSLATQANFKVDLVGYSGSACFDSVCSNRDIRVHGVQPFSFEAFSSKFGKSSKFLFTLMAPIKVMIQMLQLFKILLFHIQPPNILLLQNPPAIPTLAVALVYSWLIGCRVIIDWHNLGYSILSLRLGLTHPLVRCAKLYERILGRITGDEHLCVSKSMQSFLLQEWGIHSHVLYDRPPQHFYRRSIQQQHQLLMELESSGVIPANELRSWLAKQSFEDEEEELSSSLVEKTLFTVFDPSTGSYSYRRDRPVLLVSSTSWTPDEDFSVLLDALTRYEKSAQKYTAANLTKKSIRLPNLLVFITGKGPERARYEKEISVLNRGFKYVQIVTLWVSASQYSGILGSADLGVCLHTSSSGIDLPMKIVDMYGSTLPVCAVKFTCIAELVHDGETGTIFNNSQELADQLTHLLGSFPDTVALDAMRSNIISEHSSKRWADLWPLDAKPAIEAAYRRSSKSTFRIFVILLFALSCIILTSFLGFVNQTKGDR